MGYYLYYDSLLTSLLTSKPVRRLVQASVSPLLADWTFSITAPIRVRCSSTMEALCSAANKVSGTSRWTKVAGGIRAPPPLEPYWSPELSLAGGRIQDGPRLQHPWGSAPPCVRSPLFSPPALPQQSPELRPGLGPFGTTPRCCPRLWGRRPSGGSRCPSHPGPTNLLTKIARCRTRPDCRICDSIH